MGGAPDRRHQQPRLLGVAGRHRLAQRTDEQSCSRSRRAEESGEYEAIEACLIDCPDMHRKRRRIVQAAWWRGLSVKVEVELEADPRETLLLVKVWRGGAA